MAEMHILPTRFTYDFERREGSFALRYREWHNSLGEEALKEVYENVKRRYQSSPILKQLNVSLAYEIKERVIEVNWITDNKLAPLNIISEILVQIIENEHDMTIASNFMGNILNTVAREKGLRPR